MKKSTTVLRSDHSLSLSNAHIFVSLYMSNRHINQVIINIIFKSKTERAMDVQLTIDVAN